MIQNSNNIFAAFTEAAKTHTDRPALIADGGLGRTYSYKEVQELASRLGAGLKTSGLTAKREIGLLSENRPEWCLGYMAVLAAGGTVVPIDANLKNNEISYIIDHAQLDVVICSGKFEQMLSGLGRSLKLVSLEKNSSNSFIALLSDHSIDTSTALDNDLAVLIYTSGTTGDPKAVELTHRNLLANIEGIEEALTFGQSDCFLSVLPLHHTFEATCGFLTPLLSGARIVYARSLKSRDILEDIKRNNVTVMCGVPLLYEKMFHSISRAVGEAPLIRRAAFRTMYAASSVGWTVGQKWGRALFQSLRQKAGLSSIRMFVSGGAALSVRVSAFFNRIGFDMVQGYGMTECSPVISCNHPDRIKFGSVGVPLGNLEIRISDANSEGIGEIAVKGESITRGYRNNPEQTAQLIRDGWLYTGDLGRIHRGDLWITGRAKNLIVSAAGKNIYPEEIEEKLLESEKILEAIVFGRQKANRQGEDVHAVIVPDMESLNMGNSESVDMEDVKRIMQDEISRVNESMAAYKRIASFDVQLEELEKTSTRKVKRTVYK